MILPFGFNVEFKSLARYPICSGEPEYLPLGQPGIIGW
jgi:hypothetical protein